jgi:uncharacterized membrane protein YcaP (DUF421 family)
VHFLAIAGRTAAVYVAVLLGLRLGGRREIGQLTPFDLVVVLLVANAVQNAMVGPDTSLAGGLVSAAVLIALNAVVARTRIRSARLRHLVEGVPVVLVQHGEWVTANLRRESITQDEVLAALREHGDADVANVALAVLETDGSISVVPMTARMHRTERRLRHRKV